jgi:crotonobetainyl-CoA:carnitine CoA-transferase CaiB-like acyl-CoA transferase
MKAPIAIAGELLALAGLPAEGLEIAGAEPVLPSSFRVDAAAAATIGAAGQAAALLHQARGGGAQTVRVALRHAAAEFRSEHLVRVAGEAPGEMWDPIAGLYPTGDGSWLRLHTNFPHHRAGVLRLLGCEGTREAVAKALRGWEAETFETAATDAGLCVAAARGFASWDAHPHAAFLAETPFRLARIAGAPPIALPPAGPRPLDGIRVLDLTRVIAGPVAARTLAAHGADVLHITGPGVPNLPRLVVDTGRGKRAAELDLRTESGRARLRALVRGADVFLQSYRDGALAALGFSDGELAMLRPGLVIATLNAYGRTGPWGGKRGFDSLVQTATGFNLAEAEAAGEAKPRPLPCQALDHASGYLLALAIMAALQRRAREGGTWHAEATLAATGRWLRTLGRLEDGFAAPGNGTDDAADLLYTAGRVTAVRHAAELSATPTRWDRAAEPLGCSTAEWLARAAPV